METLHFVSKRGQQAPSSSRRWHIIARALRPAPHAHCQGAPAGAGRPPPLHSHRSRCYSLARPTSQSRLGACSSPRDSQRGWGWLPWYTAATFLRANQAPQCSQHQAAANPPTSLALGFQDLPLLPLHPPLGSPDRLQHNAQLRHAALGLDHDELAGGRTSKRD